MPVAIKIFTIPVCIHVKPIRVIRPQIIFPGPSGMTAREAAGLYTNFVDSDLMDAKKRDYEIAFQ
jgi:hypothetical protein